MNLKDYEIIDFHTHPFGFGGENICSHAAHCDMSPENIVRDMKAAGVSKICGSVLRRRSVMISQGADQSITEWDAVMESNAAMLKLKELLGDFYVPGMMVHPDFVDKSCAEIERMYSLGVRLIGELVPYMQGWNDYSCDGFSQILDFATEKNMIVSLHSMGEDEMDRMVQKHPDTKFVFAHPGEYGNVIRHFKRLKMSENCYIDLSGYGIFRHGMLRALIDEVGIERVIFGSDYPTCNPYMYVGGVLLDPLISDEEKEAIFAGNIRKLYKSVNKNIWRGAPAGEVKD